MQVRMIVFPGEEGLDVVISEDFWNNWFNRAPEVVGRKIVIANTPFTVVGVMPKRFIGADVTQRPENLMRRACRPTQLSTHRGIILTLERHRMVDYGGCAPVPRGHSEMNRRRKVLHTHRLICRCSSTAVLELF